MHDDMHDENHPVMADEQEDDGYDEIEEENEAEVHDQHQEVADEDEEYGLEAQEVDEDRFDPVQAAQGIEQYGRGISAMQDLRPIYQQQDDGLDQEIDDQIEDCT